MTGVGVEVVWCTHVPYGLGSVWPKIGRKWFVLLRRDMKKADCGLWSKRRSYEQCRGWGKLQQQHYMFYWDKVKEELHKQEKDLPVPVAPELFVEIGAVAVVISKWGFALNPVYNVSLHSFTHTETHRITQQHKQDEEAFFLFYICYVNTHQLEPPGWYQVFCHNP